MYTKRLAENFVQKASLLFDIQYKVLKFIVDQVATPRLADTGSQRLPDSPMRGVGESTKGKLIALDLYVCLLFQASLVQLKHACAKKMVHFKFFSAVGYSAKKF